MKERSNSFMKKSVIQCIERFLYKSPVQEGLSLVSLSHSRRGGTRVGWILAIFGDIHSEGGFRQAVHAKKSRFRETCNSH